MHGRFSNIRVVPIICSATRFGRVSDTLQYSVLTTRSSKTCRNQVLFYCHKPAETEYYYYCYYYYYYHYLRRRRVFRGQEIANSRFWTSFKQLSTVDLVLEIFQMTE